jgi:hypothetical protein
MRPLRNIFMGLTVGAGLNTLMMVILNENMLIGPFTGITAALLATTIGIHYVDWRLRRDLLTLLRGVEMKPPRYEDHLRIVELEDDISSGLSLTTAAKRVGELSQELGFNVEIESPHV